MAGKSRKPDEPWAPGALMPKGLEFGDTGRCRAKTDLGGQYVGDEWVDFRVTVNAWVYVSKDGRELLDCNPAFFGANFEWEKK